MNPTEAPIYSRQLAEGSRAYEAFVLYRDLPASDRSLAEVARRLHKSRSLIGKWASRHRWSSRIRAWEADIERRTAEADLDVRKEARGRATRLGRLMTALAAMKLGDIASQRQLALRLTVSEARQLGVEGAKLEFLGLGLAGVIAEQTRTQAAPEPEDDLLAVLEELSRRLAHQPGASDGIRTFNAELGRRLAN